jgi:hypothetical protein
MGKADLRIDWATHEAAKYAIGTIARACLLESWSKLAFGKKANLSALCFLLGG